MFNLYTRLKIWNRVKVPLWLPSHILHIILYLMNEITIKFTYKVMGVWHILNYSTFKNLPIGSKTGHDLISMNYISYYIYSVSKKLNFELKTFMLYFSTRNAYSNIYLLNRIKHRNGAICFHCFVVFHSSTTIFIVRKILRT